MTLWCHFILNSFFIVGLTRFFCLDFGYNYVKTTEDTPVLSATKMFAMDSTFWGRTVYADTVGFSLEDSSINSGVVRSGQFSTPLVFRTFII